jgi:hypothetical protein
MRCSRRLVAVSFCNMLLNVIGFCLIFTVSLSAPAFGAWPCCSFTRVSRAEKTSPKVLKGLLEPSRSYRQLMSRASYRLPVV